MNKNDVVELVIEDMSVEGQGIGRVREDDTGEPGMVVFVKGAVAGDRVQARLTKVKKNMAFGDVVETLEESPLRSEEFDCPYHCEGCGGCPMGELSYGSQLEIKERNVRNRLERIAQIEDPRLRPIVGMEEGDNGDQGCWRYRNKATFPVSTGGIITRKGGIVEALADPAVGFYQAKSHDVVDCGDCYLQSMAAMAAADALRRFMAEDGITGFDPRWDKGLMRRLVVKTAFGTGEVMVVLAINGKGIPGIQKLVEMLDDAVSDVGYSLESVVLEIDKAGGKTCEYVTVAGSPVIKDRISDLEFDTSPASFFQVNPVQMKRLYDVVREYVAGGGRPGGSSGSERGGRLERSSGTAGSGRPVILDLYCGVGSIGLYCADLAEMIIGIETVREAIDDANRNSVINHIVNTRYICGKAEEVIPAALSGSGEQAIPEDLSETMRWIGRADIAILDPPRAGCRKELLDAVAFAEIPRIIYVSCDPATLARDIKILTESGYDFVEATPVDMFPHTGHVETVCLLSNRKPDTKVRIDVDLEDYYRIKDAKKNQN